MLGWETFWKSNKSTINTKFRVVLTASGNKGECEREAGLGTGSHVAKFLMLPWVSGFHGCPFY